jgi:hypothetical protein
MSDNHTIFTIFRALIGAHLAPLLFAQGWLTCAVSLSLGRVEMFLSAIFMSFLVVSLIAKPFPKRVSMSIALISWLILFLSYVFPSGRDLDSLKLDARAGVANVIVAIILQYALLLATSYCCLFQTPMTKREFSAFAGTLLLIFLSIWLVLSVRMS